MNQAEIEKIILSLIDTFVYSGKVCQELRKKGLKKQIKSWFGAGGSNPGHVSPKARI